MWYDVLKEIFFKDYFSKGMTFAVENLIKLFSSDAKCTEVPITLYKDGRIKNRSHLKTSSDDQTKTFINM